MVQSRVIQGPPRSETAICGPHCCQILPSPAKKESGKYNEPHVSHDIQTTRRAEVSSILAQEHRKSLRRVKAPSKQSCLWPHNMGGTHGGVVPPPIFYLWGMGQGPFMEKSSRKEFNRVDHS